MLMDSHLLAVLASVGSSECKHKDTRVIQLVAMEFNMLPYCDGTNLDNLEVRVALTTNLTGTERLRPVT